MADDNSILTNAFTIDLSCSLALKCAISECPMDYTQCPFGYDGNDSKLCAKVSPSMWVKTLKEQVR
jgi:hypothetical protein